MINHLALYYQILFLLLGVSTFSSAQVMSSPDIIQGNLYNQLELFPQEKIHLHTDRNAYVCGEKIWFKVYVVDAYLHRAPTFSQYAYVELINSLDTVVYRVMVKLDGHGLFHGSLFLSELIPEGDYLLIAYTRHMENLGDNYFFKKPIRIVSSKSVAPQIQRLTNIDYDVSFYPEGGNMTEGTLSRIAFKALNQDGFSESISGYIVDNEGSVITNVTTVFAGMGSFSVSPGIGHDYFLVCKNREGLEKRFQLPSAKKTCTLNAKYRNKSHFIQVKKSPDFPEQPLFLLIHCKGDVLFFKPLEQNNETITFTNHQFPSGVIQIILFDKEMNPISERLIFNKNEEQVKINFSSDKPFYQKREKASFDIYLTDKDGNPLIGDMSIAITDDKDIAIDSLYTITSSLLLSSELKGFIELPGYYLQDNANAAYALDHLLMTHGWRRYEVSEAIKENYSYPDVEYEFEKELSGVVKKNKSGRPVTKREVTFISSNGGFGKTNTSSDGSFRFSNLHFPDSSNFFVQANIVGKSSDIVLVLKPEQFPKQKYTPFSMSLLPYNTMQINQTYDSTSTFFEKAGQRIQYNENIKEIDLEEVVVSAKRIIEKDKARLQYWYNEASDVTIYRDEHKGANKVTQLLYNIPGVRILPDGKIAIRGPYRSDPLVLIDGLIMPWGMEQSPLEMVDINEVESIDVFKSANPFGARGGSGVISITTRRQITYIKDNLINTNSASIIPIGYQQPVEFYSPKYDSPELKNHNVPDSRTTIFWKPDLLVFDNGKASFDFYTSDFSTTYSVVIEGITSEGKIIQTFEKLVIK